MSEQEKERPTPASDDPEVEGHRRKYGDEGPKDEEIGKRETDEEPDVEAHRRK